jgi:hypothetical protein
MRMPPLILIVDDNPVKLETGNWGRTKVDRR